MADLGTTYLGLPLGNPILVGSCGYTKDADGVRQCADAGAGGVVLKSIFEEQIREDFSQMAGQLTEATYHPEAYDYFRADLAARYGAHDYCKNIEAMRKAVEIPVIASINCYSDSAWSGFARDIENAGAHALELNVSFPPLAYLDRDPMTHVEEMAKVAARLSKEIAIPLTVKIPPAGPYSYPMAARMVKAGAKGLVCFNRFIVPEVDTDALEVLEGASFSDPSECDAVRRMIGIIARRLEVDLVASGGIHTARQVAAMLLVGAAAVQVVSVLYRKDPSAIGELRDGLAAWMDRHGFASIQDFRGRLAADKDRRDSPFGRFQYIQILTEQV